jgi:APA family basic amino acid/polyamine antiporter
MAEDRLFFSAIAKVHPATRVPIVAIAVQGVVAVVIALTGTYEKILSYVVSVDFIFFGLTGLALFVFRRGSSVSQSLGPSVSPSNRATEQPSNRIFRTPLHPFTTAVFTIACWLVVAGTVIAAPVNSAIGLGILFAGLPAYWFWRSRRNA